MRKRNSKKTAAALLLAGSAMIITACASNLLHKGLLGKTGSGNAKIREFSPQHILIASDLHYLSPKLTDHGEYFTRMIRNSDGKTMAYSDELMDAFVSSVITKKPDALVLTGDLTFNGERQSHIDLAEKLMRVKNAGIPVLVLSGNHDLNNPNAAAFSGNGFSRVRTVSAREFEQIYQDFGISEAMEKDTASSSYLYPLTPGLRLLLLDVNGVEKENRVPEKTLKWIEKVLKKAEKDGCRVLAFSHQNLLKHSIFDLGYVIDNREEVLKLYQKYAVSVNFTGHLHIQDIGKERFFYEVSTSALSIPPEPYGEVIVRPGSLEYEENGTEVSSWAKKKGIKDKNLLHFRKYAEKFYLDCCRRQAESALKDRKESRMKRQMIEYFAQRNYAYFSGKIWHSKKEDPKVLGEWEKTETFIGSYLESLDGRDQKDERHLSVKFPD